MRNAWLERWKIIDSLRMELELSKGVFVSRLQEIVEPGSINTALHSFEIFSRDQRPYKGQVDLNGFKIRKKRRMFDFNHSLSVAEGTFDQERDRLVIQAKIDGFKPLYLFYYFLLIFIYGWVLGSILLTNARSVEPDTPGFVVLLIVLHALFMFTIPYFIMRYGTRQLKRELEREFFFLTKN